MDCTHARRGGLVPAAHPCASPHLGLDGSYACGLPIAVPGTLHGRASSPPRMAFLGPLGSVLREPGSFSVSQQWPRSRYVKLTLACKALASRALIGMVRYERSGAGCSREQLLSTSIVSWPRTREHADGAGGQQGCSSPFHDLAALCSRGDRYATRAKRGKAPPKRVMAQTKLHFSHASSMSFPTVPYPHALLLPH